MLAELYPTALRGARQGLTYNLGRLLSAAAPFVTGFVAGALLVYSKHPVNTGSGATMV